MGESPANLSTPAIGSGLHATLAQPVGPLPRAPDSALTSPMPQLIRRPSVEHRQQKITLGEMRSSGVRALLVYCADYKCGQLEKISADRWPAHTRLSDLDQRFVC